MFEFFYSKMFFIITWFKRQEEPHLCSPTSEQPRCLTGLNLGRTLREKELFRLTGDVLGTERHWRHVVTAAQCPARTGVVSLKWKMWKGKGLIHSSWKILDSSKEGGTVNGRLLESWDLTVCLNKSLSLPAECNKKKNDLHTSEWSKNEYALKNGCPISAQ